MDQTLCALLRTCAGSRTGWQRARQTAEQWRRLPTGEAERAQRDTSAGVAAARDAARVLVAAAKRAAEQELQLAGANFKVRSTAARMSAVSTLDVCIKDQAGCDGQDVMLATQQFQQPTGQMTGA